MKYDPETTMIEFTVEVDPEVIAVVYEQHTRDRTVLMPVAALLELLTKCREHVSPHHVLDELQDHPNFQAALREYLIPEEGLKSA